MKAEWAASLAVEWAAVWKASLAATWISATLILKILTPARCLRAAASREWANRRVSQ